MGMDDNDTPKQGKRSPKGTLIAVLIFTLMIAGIAAIFAVIDLLFSF
jgi:preprotein translocase subunit SecE